MEASDFSKLINDWFHSKCFTMVFMEEDFKPYNDPLEDYDVLYSVKFLSKQLEVPFFEIYLSSGGYIGACVEKYDKIKIKYKENKNKCVSGFEPQKLNPTELIKFLNCVSNGGLKFIFYKNIFIQNLIVKIDSKYESIYGDILKKRNSYYGNLMSNLFEKKDIISYQPWR